MTVGQLGIKHPSLAGMVDAIKNKISRESLHERFTESAVEYMEICARFILRKKIQSQTLQTKLLDTFNRVFLVDSSSWDIDPKLSDILPGSGGSASRANCKTQTFYEYKSGEISLFELTPGTNPDNKYTKQIPARINPKDLLIADLGYFSLNTFNEIIQKSAFFISRFKIGTCIWDSETLKPIELKKVLMGVNGNAYQMDVKIGADEKTRVSCQLVCLRVKEEIANNRRMRLKKEARKKGRIPGAQSLALADWTVMITNVPEKWIPFEMLWRIYAIRWQIELLFKQLKSVLQVHHSNTGNVCRLKCETYGKLIMATLISRIHGAINAELWNTNKRELSMDKFYKRIQERAFHLLELLLTSVSKAVNYLKKEVIGVIKNCMKCRQPSRMTTLQSLEENIFLIVEDLKVYA
jgi:hypothetical protein